MQQSTCNPLLLFELPKFSFENGPALSGLVSALSNKDAMVMVIGL